MHTCLIITAGHFESDRFAVKRENGGADIAIHLTNDTTNTTFYLASKMAVDLAHAILRANGLPVPPAPVRKEIEHVA